MQDNPATVLVLEALREITGELRGIREELRRVTDRLDDRAAEGPRADSPAPRLTYPRIAPR